RPAQHQPVPRRQLPPAAPPMLVASSYLECRFCGQPHVPVAAARGTRLLCTRCGITLARRSLLGPQAPLAFTFTALLLAIPALLLPFATVETIAAPRGPGRIWTRCAISCARASLLGPQAPLAFTFTALLLAIPALLLPFATVEKIGAPRSTRVIDGAVALWDHGLPVLGTTVALCGLLVPLALGITLLAGLAVRRHAARTLAAQRIVHALDAWAMPEVHVLAVLVS